MKYIFGLIILFFESMAVGSEENADFYRNGMPISFEYGVPIPDAWGFVDHIPDGWKLGDPEEKSPPIYYPPSRMEELRFDVCNRMDDCNTLALNKYFFDIKEDKFLAIQNFRDDSCWVSYAPCNLLPPSTYGGLTFHLKRKNIHINASQLLHLNLSNSKHRVFLLKNYLLHLSIIKIKTEQEVCSINIGYLISESKLEYWTPVFFINNDIHHPLTSWESKEFCFKILFFKNNSFTIFLSQGTKICETYTDYDSHFLLGLEGWTLPELRAWYMANIANKDVEATQEVEQAKPKWKRCNVQ